MWERIWGRFTGSGDGQSICGGELQAAIAAAAYSIIVAADIDENDLSAFQHKLQSDSIADVDGYRMQIPQGQPVDAAAAMGEMG